MQDEDSAVAPLLGAHGVDGAVGKSHTYAVPPSFTASTGFNQAVLMATGMMISTAAMNAALVQATSYRTDKGADALSIMYALFMLTTLVSSTMVRLLGPRMGVILGTLSYVPFLMSNIWPWRWMLYFGGAAQGAGCALLWTAQGVYITRCAHYHEVTMGLTLHSTIGYFNGLFFSIFMASQLFGNIGVALLYHNHVTSRHVFTLATVIAVMGVAMLGFLHEMPNPEDLVSRGKRESGSGLGGLVRAQMQAMSDLLNQRVMLLLIALFLYSGLSQAFILGEFPPLIHRFDEKYAVMAAFGCSDMLSSFVLGRVSDGGLGRRPVLLLGFLVHATVYSWLLLQHIMQREKEIFVTMAVLWGIGDACFNTQMYALLTTFFESQSEPAFAVMKFFTSVGPIFMFLATKHVLRAHQYCVLLLSLMLAILCVMVLDRFVRSVEVEANPGAKQWAEESTDNNQDP